MKKLFLLFFVVIFCVAADKMSPQKSVCFMMAKKYWQQGFNDGARAIMKHYRKSELDWTNTFIELELKAYISITNDLKTVN